MQQLQPNLQAGEMILGEWSVGEILVVIWIWIRADQKIIVFEWRLMLICLNLAFQRPEDR